MNKRAALNVVLLIVVIGLGLMAWFRPGIKQPPTQPPLTALKSADIHDIEIDRNNTDTVKLHLENGNWQMLAPRQMPADNFLIKAFLDNLAASTVGHFKAIQSDLDKYGLAKPQLRLKLNGTEIDFGNSEPLQGNRYVKAGDTIYLTNGILFYRLSHDALWWVDKQLLPSHAQITAIQLPDATLTLQDGKWQLAPANPDVSADDIQKLVDAWLNARAQDVIAPEQGKSRGEVAIQLAGQPDALRFTILDNPDFLLLVRPDLKLEYRLDSDEHDALLQLQAPSPKKTAAGHNGAKVKPHARTAGSRNHTPGH